MTVIDADAAPAWAGALGRTLVVVPHPDDETIGCGGLLALLGDAGNPLQLVLVSDGTGSHPNSASHPAARLQALRLREMMAALGTLGLARPRVDTLELPDGAVPTDADGPVFDTAVDRLAVLAAAFMPDTVLLPSSRDRHRDHRASQRIASVACDRAAPASRRLEYMVWAPENAHPADRRLAPLTWRIAIGAVVARKCRALEAHRSQLGRLILDDPGGFVLPATLVARCSLPIETYVDTTTWTLP